MKTSTLKIIEAGSGITGSLLFVSGHWILAILFIAIYFILAIFIDNKENNNENNTSR